MWTPSALSKTTCRLTELLGERTCVLCCSELRYIIVIHGSRQAVTMLINSVLEETGHPILYPARSSSYHGEFKYRMKVE